MERPKSKSLTLEFNTEEFDMSLDSNFGRGEPKDARDKRLLKILKEFPRLSPELQEAIIKYADTLIKEEKPDGQDPPA